jgi:type IV pilus assembly protein PilM
MPGTYLGIDIGGSAVKLALVRGGRVQRLCSSALPDNLVRESRITSPDAMGEELRRVLRESRIAAKNCALVLPPEAAFVRRVTLPYMTVEQLHINLPYEFHDYIQKDKDEYFYDYVVAGVGKDASGSPKTLDLLAAAAPKETIGSYRVMLRKAGLKLSVAVPEYLTYRNLIAGYERAHPDGHPGEYCIADMGHTAIRIHMYRSGVYDTSRVIEYGGASIDALIADTASVDPHVASDYKLANYEGAQEIPACRDLYGKIAVEILRAVNFYGFNTPGSDLRDIYFCGGLAKVGALMDTVRGSLELNIHLIEELLPPVGEQDAPSAALCPAAIGAALETDGR